MWLHCMFNVPLLLLSHPNPMHLIDVVASLRSAQLFGVSHSKAMALVSTNCTAALMHGATRRTHRGLLQIRPLDSLSQQEQAWQLVPNSESERAAKKRKRTDEAVTTTTIETTTATITTEINNTTTTTTLESSSSTTSS
jgi:hypothetical protein